MLEPQYAVIMMSYLGSRAGAGSLVTPDGQVISDLSQHAESYQSRASRRGDRGYEAYGIDANGIATISVDGSLVHKSGYMDPSSGMQGYDGIIAKLDLAEDDSRVKGVILDMDTPGGEVAGAFTAARRIAEFGKPIAAIVDELSASAGYLLASQTDKIYTNDQGRSGSVGVITAHADYSRALEAGGIVVTLITAGEHKADGNSYEALPRAVYDTIKGELEEMRLDFASIVAKGRGMDLSDVLGTEARVYRGKAAKKLGFADHLVSSPGKAVAHFARNYVKGASASLLTNRQGKTDMSLEDNHVTAEAVEKARAEGFAAGKVEGNAEGLKAGATAERERISAIINSEAAAGKPKFALHCALTADVSAEAAISLIAGAASEDAGDAKATQATNTVSLEGLKNGAGAPAESHSEKDSKAAAAFAEAFARA